MGALGPLSTASCGFQQAKCSDDGQLLADSLSYAKVRTNGIYKSTQMSASLRVASDAGIAQFGLKPGNECNISRKRTNTSKSPEAPEHRRSRSEAWTNHVAEASALPAKTSIDLSVKPVIEKAAPSQRLLAWSPQSKSYVHYECGPLLNGEKVLDLWYKGGTLVYFRSPVLRKRPSFRLPSQIFADSRTLKRFIVSEDGKNSLQNISASLRQNMVSDLQASTENVLLGNVLSRNLDRKPALRLPLRQTSTSPCLRLPREEEIEMMILYRNFFAFLVIGELVLTARQRSVAMVLISVSQMLLSLEYLQEDSQTFSSLVNTAFETYCDGCRFQDVRSGIRRNVEALALAEAFRSCSLYHEAFVHAVGRFEELKALNNPWTAIISAKTLDNLELASLQLHARMFTVWGRLKKFSFPSILDDLTRGRNGCNTDTSSLKAWRAKFCAFRRFTWQYYRKKYGSWPPHRHGHDALPASYPLSRSVLRQLYDDFKSLYDILVQLPTATNGQPNCESETGKIISSLRQVQERFDRSAPPVVPSIPLDVPNLPKRHGDPKVEPTTAFNDVDFPIDAKEQDRLLWASYNVRNVQSTPWIRSFLEFERQQNAKTLTDLINGRCGHWLFLYAVMQTLPLVVIDAPGLQFSDGVEYFLCMHPQNGPPWLASDSSPTEPAKRCTTLANATNDVFYRSHCWQKIDSGALQHHFERQQSSTTLSPRSSISKGNILTNRTCVKFTEDDAFPMALKSFKSHRGTVSPVFNQQSDTHRRAVSAAATMYEYEKSCSPSSTPRKASLPDPSVTFESILGYDLDQMNIEEDTHFATS